MYKHIYLLNINNLYKTAVKCDDHQQYKEIIEAAMVSTPEVFINNSPISYIQYVTVKKPSAIKPLHKFLEALDVKHKTFVHRLGDAKSKLNSIVSGNTLW